MCAKATNGGKKDPTIDGKRKRAKLLPALSSLVFLVATGILRGVLLKKKNKKADIQVCLKW